MAVVVVGAVVGLRGLVVVVAAAVVGLRALVVVVVVAVVVVVVILVALEDFHYQVRCSSYRCRSQTNYRHRSQYLDGRRSSNNKSI